MFHLAFNSLHEHMEFKMEDVEDNNCEFFGCHCNYNKLSFDLYFKKLHFLMIFEFLFLPSFIIQNRCLWHDRQNNFSFQILLSIERTSYTINFFIDDCYSLFFIFFIDDCYSLFFIFSTILHRLNSLSFHKKRRSRNFINESIIK